MSLVRDREFLKYWLGQAVSELGSQVTFLALPLVAVVTLQASAFEVGLLAAAGQLPHVLFGLSVGVWVDRLRRRPLMIAADVGRAIVLAAVPASWWLGALSIELLLAVAFVGGALRTVSAISSGAYLPGLVGRERLLDATAKLSMSRSAAQVAGPGLAGLLVQSLSAPVAIAADAASYGLAAIATASIRRAEPRPVPTSERRAFWAELRAGLSLVRGHPLLRPLVAASAWIGFWNGVLETVWLLFLTRNLRLEPALIGAIFAIGSIGPLVGSLVSARLVGWLGIGRALILGLILTSISDLTAPALGWTSLPGSAPGAIVAALAAAQVLFGTALLVFNVASDSLRTAVTPDDMRGRVGGSTRFLVYALGPVAALLGGLLGDTIGLEATYLVAIGGELLAVLWILGSPVRGCVSLTAYDEESARERVT